MGEEDIRRQAPNVFRMKILGAEVVPVAAGTATLKDAMNEAMRAWVTTVRDTFYVIGTTAGPHPYPMMVRDFQSVIGRETRRQILKQEGRLPDCIIACVGGGSNAMGIFYPFRNDENVKLIGVEAAGLGIATGKHSASISAGRIGVLHGNKTYLLQDEAGQIREAHSVAAGLDYPGVGPEHSYFKKTGRANYVSVEDGEALEAFRALCACEDHPRHRERARDRLCHEACAYAEERPDHRHQPLGPGDKDAGDHRRIDGRCCYGTH